MSVLATSSMGNGWPSSPMSYPSMSGLKDFQACMGLQMGYGRVGAFTTAVRPALRCYQSQPYTLGSANAPLQYQDVLDQAMNKAVPVDETFAVSSQQMYEGSDRVNRERARGGSPPISSITQLSPQAEQDSVTDDDDETSLSADEQDEDVMNGGVSKASAELRADKRKMKRFRLTHNQTRFLMSEFTRQAHPDAAQRERLSKDIPGLSPRQVQVWFQNRRAKLKRLTSDARELVIKSRALPENFDMSQALRSPFASKLGHPNSRLVPSPASYAPRFDGPSSVRPLTNEGIRHGLGEDDNSASSMNSNSTYGNFYTSTEPYAASEGFSPVSPFSERSDYANQFAAHSSNTRSPTSYPRSQNLANYSSYTPSTGENHDDPISRVRATSLATSLRTSMSYPQLSSEYGENLANNSATPAMSTQMEHHNGYSLDSMLVTHPTGYPAGTQGYESVVSADAQPLATPFSSTASQGSHHRLLLPSASTSQIYNVQGLQSAPLASPQDFRIPSTSGFYNTSAVHTGYDLVYGDQGHKFKKEASSENLSAMDAPMQTHYNSQGSVKQEQPQRTPNEVFSEAAQGGAMQPPHAYNAGRHRSFTLPMNYSTCR